MKLGSKIYILGSGGFARELEYYISHLYSDPLSFNITFVDDSGWNISVKNYQKLVNDNRNTPTYSIIGSGNCKIKARMLQELRGPIMSFRHPKSIILTNDIGEGSVLAPGCVVAPNSKIGRHVLCNYNCTIGHNTVIGDLSVVSPNASIGGNCNIGSKVFVGSNATIIERINIGDGAIIGAGAAVINDIPSWTTVVGVPARPIRRDNLKDCKNE